MASVVAGKSSGGKGNLGMFIERDTNICAAGLPSPLEQTVGDTLKRYTLQDTVDALIGDSIKPLPTSTVHKAPMRKNKIQDMRNAGIFSEGANLINPPVKTRFQTLEEDFKNTAYNSYWNKQVGKIRDPVPFLPKGFKIYETTLGKKTPYSNNLYEVITPVDAVPDRSPSKEPGYQITRNYRSFNPNATFGQKSVSDISVKHCLTYNKLILGTGLKVPMNEKQAYFQDTTVPKLGVTLTPNKNIDCVPEGFAFGKVESYLNDLPDFLRTCEMNSNKELLIKCLGYLNGLRNSLSKRFEGSFFKTFYLNLKYLDESKNGWLEKQTIYDQCKIRYIRCNPNLIEPLLQIWNAFDGSRINYKLFTRIINFREPFPELPKMHESSNRLIDFTTTYSELGKYDEEIPEKQYRAGVPSGRYFDKDYPVTPADYCKADRVYLPEESDMRACLIPSIFTLLGVSHRDMYAKRDPATVRKILEKAGEKFDDETFNEIWKMAQKLHSQGWVCLETFRRSIKEYEKNRNIK